MLAYFSFARLIMDEVNTGANSVAKTIDPKSTSRNGKPEGC